MMKLLIIDDEPNIRQGLRGIIDWAGLGFGQIAEAQDGEEGLAKLLATYPDLILLDIRMPKKDGLQLVKEARSAGFQGEVIMLSGHSDFDYARRAIANNVGAYLLKPIDEAELEREVRKAAENIARSRESRRIGTLYEKNAIHAALVSLIVGSPDEQHALLLPRALSRFKKAFRVGILCGNSTLGPNELLSYCGDDSIIFIASLGGEIALLFTGTGDAFEQILRLDFPEGGVCLYISQPLAGMDEISPAYRVVRAAASNHSFYIHGRMEDGWHVRVVGSDGGDMDSAEQLERDLGDIVHCLNGLDQDGLMRLLGEKESLFATQCVPAERVRSFFMALVTGITNRLKDQHPQLAGAFPADGHQIEQIQNRHTLRALMSYVQTTLTDIIDLLETETDSDVIARMRNYISVHYADKLRIDALAAMFGYNSAYLGKLFRSETGHSFNTYVELVRMNHAKQLLADTSLLVYEVAQRVGFSDVDYFYRKFTAHTGESPREYQKRMGRPKP